MPIHAGNVAGPYTASLKGGYIFVERGEGELRDSLSTMQTVGGNSYITLTCMLVVVLKVS